MLTLPVPFVELHPAGLYQLQRSGRWQKTNAGSLVASWCGASLRFLCTGRSLSIRAGPVTERKDRFNGGTPMICYVISGATRGSDNVVGSCDTEASQTIQLFNSSQEDVEIPIGRVVELTLIDWASVFELEAIITPSAGDIHPPPPLHQAPSPSPIRALFIGDSISCGYTDGSAPIPRGCLDAFPFLARDRFKKETGVQIAVDLLAFPGMRLTDPTEEEIKQQEGGGDLPNGMGTRFFHASPWSNSVYDSDDKELHPTLLVIALGTNDEAQDVDPQRFQTALCAFVSKLSTFYSKSLAQIIIVHPFPDFTDEQIDDTSDAEPVPSLASQFPSFVDALARCVPHINISSCDIGSSLRREHTMDGLHPTAEGQKILAAAWMDASKSIMEEMRQ